MYKEVEGITYGNSFTSSQQFGGIVHMWLRSNAPAWLSGQLCSVSACPARVLQRLQYARAKSDAVLKAEGTFRKDKKQRQKGALPGAPPGCCARCALFACWGWAWAGRGLGAARCWGVCWLCW